MGLSDLPVELVDSIAACLTAPGDLSAWSRTSRKFYDELEDRLYSFILLRDARAATAFSNAIAGRTSLAPLVKTLYVNGARNFGQSKSPCVEVVENGFAISRLSGLENLYLHYPAGGDQDQLIDLFEHFPNGSALPSLKQCSIFIWDQRHYKYYTNWHLDKYWKVFLHPNLQALTIHDSTFRWDISQGDGRDADLIHQLRGTSSLKRLHLYGSHMSFSLFCHLLLVPRALEELVHEAPSFDPWLDRTSSAEAMLELPVSARRSLRRLTFLHRDHPFFIRWTPFERLEYLRVYAHHILRGRLPEVAPKLADLLPPTLEVLAICDVSFYDGDRAVPDALLYLSRLLGEAPEHRVKRVELELSDHSHSVPKDVFESFEGIGVQLTADRRFSEDQFRWGGKDDWPQDPPIWLEE